MELNMTKGIYGQINLHLQCARNLSIFNTHGVAIGLK